MNQGENNSSLITGMSFVLESYII